MAGHRRTIRARGIHPATRLPRRVPRAPEQVRPTARDRRLANMRALVNERLAAEPDPVARLAIAVGHLRAAIAKAPDADLQPVIDALLTHSEQLVIRSPKEAAA